METIFYEIRTVDRVTKSYDRFTFVGEYEIIAKGNVAFLKIVHYPDQVKREIAFIALDTIREFSVEEMEENQ